MARKKKEAPVEEEIRNTPDPEVVMSYIEAIEAADAEIQSIKARAGGEVAGVNKRKKSHFREAKNEGISKKTLDFILADRKHKRKQEERASDMSKDEVDDLKITIESLGVFGETALGAAAIDSARKRQAEAQSEMDEFEEASA